MIHPSFKDLRYGLRSLLSTPLASLTVVLSLGIGMGVTTTAFSILNAMALHDLPGVVDQDRLVTFGLALPERGESVRASRFSVPDLEALERHGELFSHVAAAGPGLAAVDMGNGAELAEVEAATPDFFRTLGARPEMGRFFATPEPGTPRATGGEGPVAVMSYRYWRSRFGGDPGVLGRTVRVNGQPVEIVGVAQEGFTGMTAEDVVSGARRFKALWLPISMARSLHLHPSPPGVDPTGVDARWLQPVARLAEGASLEGVAAALPGLARELQDRYPESRAGVEILYGDLVFGPGAGSWRPTLTVLGFMVVPLIVLLVACANAANVLLARNSARRRELALRKALGASRPALLRQLLVESLILAVGSGWVGLLVALGAGHIASLFTIHLSMDVPLDWNVFGFTLAASLGAGILLGLLPALGATRQPVVQGLSGSSRGQTLDRGDSRLRDLLVVSQVALGLLLLVSSGLFVRSAQHGMMVDSGLREDRLLLLSLDLSLLDYEAPEGEDFYRRLATSLREMPGVEQVALADQSLLQGYPMVRLAPSRLDPSHGERMALAHVGAGYLEAVGLELEAGRAMADAASEMDSGAAVVNRAAAERLWPGSAPLGRTLRLEGEDETLKVIGIVSDSRTSLYQGPEPVVYVGRSGGDGLQATLYIRTSGEPGKLVGPVRALMRRMDPRLPVKQLEPARDLRYRLLAPWRLGYTAMGALGAIALFLAGVGLHGVLGYGVSRRTREIGVRLALGASAWTVVGMVMKGAVRLVAVGLTIGFLLAAAAAALLEGFLFGVSPVDPWVYGQVGAFLLVVAVLAALPPALRAASVEPIRAMSGD